VRRPPRRRTDGGLGKDPHSPVHERWAERPASESGRPRPRAAWRGCIGHGRPVLAMSWPVDQAFVEQVTTTAKSCRAALAALDGGIATGRESSTACQRGDASPEYGWVRSPSSPAASGGSAIPLLTCFRDGFPQGSCQRKMNERGEPTSHVQVDRSGVGVGGARTRRRGWETCATRAEPGP